MSAQLRLPEGTSSLSAPANGFFAVSGTASSEDFAAQGELAFAFETGAGDGALQSVTFAIASDGLVEGDETLVVALERMTGVDVASADTLTATLLDGETAEVGFVDASPRSAEDSGTAAIRVALTVTPPTAALASDISLTLSDIGTGSAISGTDYTPLSPTVITFGAGTVGDATQNVPLTLIADAAVEADTTVAFALDGLVGPASLGTAASTLTIVDDDSVALSLVESELTVNENEGSLSVVVELSIPGDGTLLADAQVLLEVDENTAASSTDFSIPTEVTRTLQFTTGAEDGARQAVQIPITDDALFEGDETFSIRLASPTGAILGVNRQAEVTVTDNESVAVEFVEPSSSVAENAATPLTIHIRLTADPGVTLAIPVAYSILDTGTGTARAPDNYTTTGLGDQSFEVGSLAGAVQSVMLSPVDNGAVDGTRTVILGLSGSRLGNVDQHVASIVEDDSPSVALSSPAIAASEGNGSVEVAVTLNVPGGGSSTSAVEATLEVVGTSTASLSADYSVRSLNVTFPDGSMDGATQSVTVSIVDDGLVEGSETVVLALESASGAVAGTGVATVTITDNESAEAGFALSGSAVSESAGGDLVLDVTLSIDPPTGTQTTAPVVVTVSDTLAGDADPGVDYTLGAPLVFGFPAGSVDGATQQLTLTPIDDAILEGAKTVVLNASVTGASVAQASHTVTLTDDDSASLGFSSADAQVAEGSGAFNASVVLDVPGGGQLTEAVSARVEVVAGGTATGAGNDFSAPSNTTVSFPVGSSSGDSATVSFTIADDLLLEGDEQFVLRLAGFNNALPGSTDELTVTLLDDESGSIGFALANSSVSESGSTRDIDIVLDLNSPQTTLASAVTVNVSTSPASTAILTEDYTFAGGQMFTFPSGSDETATRTVSVTPVDDSIVGESVDLVLLMTASGIALGGASHTLSIVDDDTATVALTASIGAVEEGSAAQIVAELTVPGGGSVANPVSAVLALANETATGADYTSPNLAGRTLTFPAGASDGDTTTVTIPSTNDALYERDETFVVTLGSPSGVDLGGTISQRVTIEDDETATVGFRTFASSIEEDAGAELEVEFFLSLDAASTAVPIQVTISDLGTGSAQAGADFNVVGGLTRTFPIGSEDDDARAIRISPVDDAILQGARTIDLGLATSDANTALTTTTVTILEDDAATVVFNPTALTVGESSASATVTVELSVPGSGATLPSAGSVDVALVPGSTSASAGDFTFTSPQTVNFSAGSSDGAERTVNVGIAD
ncbi:MAG: Calx-beta domain-containing protein, partial [Myxococcota bacterium]